MRTFTLSKGTRWILFSVCFISTPLLARTADACGCDDNPPCAAFWQADAVFIGKAVNAYSEPVGASAWWVTTISVSQPLRGATEPYVTLLPWLAPSSVTTHAPGQVMSTCDYQFELGREYVIYAFKTADGRWRTTKCSGTKPLEEAIQDLDYIANLPVTSVGRHIHGRVEQLAAHDSLDNDGPAVGIRVVLRGDGNVFQVVTDSRGMFDAEVPSGDYVVAPILPSTAQLHTSSSLRVSPPPQGCAPVYFSFSLAPS